MDIWKINKTVYSVSDFLTWQRTGSLQLSPSFQRRPVWTPGAKSYLIDTIIRGYPIPIIFLREMPTDLKSFKSKREVVDGQQRIRTVLSFIDPTCLEDYKPARDDFTISKSHNEELKDKKFSELPSSYQQVILNYQFSTHVFPSDTDDKSILQIFARMNSTGVPLNAQELRNSKFFGEFKTTVYTISAEQLNRWRKWKLFTERDIARMNEVEFTSEIFSLIIQGISGKSSPLLDKLYRTYDAEFSMSNEVIKRFRHIMDCIEDNFTTTVPQTFSRTPIFYCLFAVLYDKVYGLESEMITVRPNRLTTETIKSIQLRGNSIIRRTAPDKVLESADRRTTNPGSRKTIISYLSNLD